MLGKKIEGNEDMAFKELTNESKLTEFLSEVEMYEKMGHHGK